MLGHGPWWALNVAVCTLLDGGEKAEVTVLGMMSGGRNRPATWVGRVGYLSVWRMNPQTDH
jgi:hypothetical protein